MSYVLRKDADDFTEQLIRDGWDIEIVDEKPEFRVGSTCKFVCTDGINHSGMTLHRWDGVQWICTKCEKESR